jgi:hypothetical protein
VHVGSEGVEVIGHDPAGGRARTVWFTLGSIPGVVVALTMRDDGEVVGFEAHGDVTDRYWPVGRGDEADAAWWPPYEAVGGVAISARLLRNIPFGELAALARSSIGVMAGWREEGFKDMAEMLAKAGFEGNTATDLVRTARRQTRRPGRRGRPDSYYANLAVAYEAWAATGDKLDVLAEKMYLSVGGLRSALGVARRRGMLTPAPVGRAGGQATSHARALAREG